METNKRTSGEWKRNGNLIFSEGRGKAILECVFDYSKDTYDESIANLDFAVTACNGYEALLKERDELKEALQELSKYVDNLLNAPDYDLGMQVSQTAKSTYLFNDLSFYQKMAKKALSLSTVK